MSRYFISAKLLKLKKISNLLSSKERKSKRNNTKWKKGEYHEDDQGLRTENMKVTDTNFADDFKPVIRTNYDNGKKTVFPMLMLLRFSLFIIIF